MKKPENGELYRHFPAFLPYTGLLQAALFKDQPSVPSFRTPIVLVLDPFIVVPPIVTVPKRVSRYRACPLPDATVFLSSELP